MQNKNFIGVGGLLIKGDQVLLVKQNYGAIKGKWVLPGGHVDPGEDIHHAVLREVKEETSIEGVVKGIIGVRSKVLNSETTDVYLVFLMDYQSGEPQPDGYENTEARFFHMDEVETHPDVVELSKQFIRMVRDQDYSLLRWDSDFFRHQKDTYKLFR